MGQLVEQILLYMNHSHNVWPLYLDDPYVRSRHATRAMQAAGFDMEWDQMQKTTDGFWYGEFHGMILVETEAIPQMLRYKPKVVVMLEAANDAARDTVALFEERLRRFLNDLKASLMSLCSGGFPLQRPQLVCLLLVVVVCGEGRGVTLWRHRRCADALLPVAVVRRSETILRPRRSFFVSQCLLLLLPPPRLRPQGNVTAGLIPMEKFVWITAPTRQYKHSHGPGEARHICSTLTRTATLEQALLFFSVSVSSHAAFHSLFRLRLSCALCNAAVTKSALKLLILLFLPVTSSSRRRNVLMGTARAAPRHLGRCKQSRGGWSGRSIPLGCAHCVARSPSSSTACCFHVSAGGTVAFRPPRIHAARGQPSLAHGPSRSPAPLSSSPRSQEMPLFWGTLDRRRKLTRIARGLVPLFFPDAQFVDFEHITEGLPSDYSLDGEHWGCPWVFWQNRHMSPYQCRSLANVVVANVLMNTLCNDRMMELGPVDIGSGYVVEERVRPRWIENTYKKDL